MAFGGLPKVDRQIMLFERWYQQRLSEITDPDHAQILNRFAIWRLLPALHAAAARAPLSHGSRDTAAGRFTAAMAFLVWLSARGRNLAEATQADIDAWHTEQLDSHRLRAFLRWAMSGGHMPRPEQPTQIRTDQAPISQDWRLKLLRRFLTDETIPLRTRVAACLPLLYAQPISRLVRLTIHDILGHDDQTTLRLGNPPVPVPAPFAVLLHELAANRANMNTAVNWLFPGGRAGQPLTPGALLQQLRALGIPVTQTRTAAFRQLVIQAPAPVVAHALGYNPATATKHVIAAGGTWSRYPVTRPHP
ncbi:hypothetical protein [Streptosporangium lutulentum]|uniref:Uncharacterized protein n=1 Tax=Streptosporangium lutulentum TaxID=1461250 RepID=A0ABT9Q8E3_9ACTN|nr:hypothetical protein [Streptosporangium lutulentum]MDP9842675.1 hypothetical protein [Streptosporangium lutulentum]